MSAYRFWTLTCDGCGEIFDDGFSTRVTECKKLARECGWSTGRSARDDDACPRCARTKADQ